MNLKVTVVDGKLIRDTETFGKMDPFVEIEHKGIKYKTSTHEDGGKTPKWNYNIEIPFEREDDKIQVSCYDEDLVSNTLIGE